MDNLLEVASERLDDAAKYRGVDAWPTFVGRDGLMAKQASERADPAQLREETKEWLSTRTIPKVREIAKDLENAGEDVHDLRAAIDDLESLVKRSPEKRSTRDGPTR